MCGLGTEEKKEVENTGLPSRRSPVNPTGSSPVLVGILINDVRREMNKTMTQFLDETKVIHESQNES